MCLPLLLLLLLNEHFFVLPQSNQPRAINLFSFSAIHAMNFLFDFNFMLMRLLLLVLVVLLLRLLRLHAECLEWISNYVSYRCIATARCSYRFGKGASHWDWAAGNRTMLITFDAVHGMPFVCRVTQFLRYAAANRRWRFSSIHFAEANETRVAHRTLEPIVR